MSAQRKAKSCPVWRFDWCGRFYSERTKASHVVCAMLSNERDSGYRG